MFYVGLVQLMHQLFEAVKVKIQVTTQTSNIKFLLVRLVQVVFNFNFEAFGYCFSNWIPTHFPYIKVKDVELSPVVNRDLSRRVRAVAGAATAKQTIRDDIKLAARLIRVLDKRSTLYEKESKEETEAREKAEKEAAEV